MSTFVGLFEHLTYKANINRSRHGWLRLTPAYSVDLVSDLIETTPVALRTAFLDPFCGTGTTALACAERGLEAWTTDINLFLIWLTSVKTTSFIENELTDFRTKANSIVVKSGGQVHYIVGNSKFYRRGREKTRPL